jgi:hypothetical protein
MTKRHTALHLLPLTGLLGLSIPNTAFADDGLGEGLVARYTFDDGDATDSAGANDGTGVGPVSYPAGLIGQAASLGGSGAYIELPAQELGDFTVSAWFKQSASTGSWARVWDFGASGGAGGDFFLAANHGRLYGQLGLGIHSSGGANVQDVSSGFYAGNDTWYHVVVSYDQGGGGTALYVNGSLAGSGSYAAESFDTFSNQRWFLGHSNWADPDFAGLIDEVRIYDRALGGDAVASLYAEGASTDSDGDGVPDVADACSDEDATGFDTNADGCMDDSDGDGVADHLDACPGFDDAHDVDGDEAIDGCETDFDTSAVTVTVTGTVPAACTDSTGNVYSDDLPVVYAVEFAEGLAHDSYYEDPYGAYSTWGAEWALSIGAWTESGTFDTGDYYNSWYQGQDAYYGEYVSGVVSTGSLYMSLSAYNDALVEDVRDHMARGASHLDGFELYAQVTNEAADACSVSWYGYGPTWGYTDLDGFRIVVTGDSDGDGVDDDLDAFPTDPDETDDEDSDGVGDNGDLCSGFPNVDSDSDEVCDASDHCPTDSYDTDADNDDICDVDDVCVGMDNVDTDGDQICDDSDLCIGNDATGDDDLDGYCVSADNCPGDTNANQADADADGVGDVCEADGDRDGIIDDADSCPDAPDADQSDLDADGAGDVCDADDDNDGVTDDTDNCPFYTNTLQIDGDGDGHGDLCDGDDDGDGLSDEADACPGTPLEAPFDAAGCSGEQRVELVCGVPDDYGWERRGKYTACVTKEATSAHRAGLLTGREKGLLVARSMVEYWVSYVSVLSRWI